MNLSAPGLRSPNRDVTSPPCHPTLTTLRHNAGRHASVIALSMAVIASACAVANQLNPLAGISSLLPEKPPPPLVFGPDSAFTVRTPALLTDAVRVKTHHDEKGLWSAMFTDGWCRGFAVVLSTTTDRPLKERIGEQVIPAFEKQGAVEIIQRTDTLANVGEAFFVRYRLPKGTPCRVEQVNGSLMPFRKSTKPDAQIAHYFFQRGDVIFDVLFGRPILRPLTNPNEAYSGALRVGPPDLLLREFVAGIEFAAPRAASARASAR